MNRKKKRVSAGRFWIFLFLAGGYGCFAKPVPELWPPASHESQYLVDVITVGLHTFILLHPSPDQTPLTYWEYGFAEKAWYLENRQGAGGALRALFWPTDSVVEVREWIGNYPREGTENVLHAWHFTLSAKGRDAMVDFLRSWYDENNIVRESGNARYYEGRYPYHLFRGCHHYTAGALRAAGLPIQPWWAFSRFLISLQLDYAEGIQLEQGNILSQKTGV